MNKELPWLLKYRHAYDSGVIDIHQFGKYLRQIYLTGEYNHRININEWNKQGRTGKEV